MCAPAKLRGRPGASRMASSVLARAGSRSSKAAPRDDWIAPRRGGAKRLFDSLACHVFSEAVAYAADRFEIFCGGAELVAQALDVGVDGAAARFLAVAPHVGQQRLARLHAPAPLDQMHEQLEFEQRQ